MSDDPNAKPDGLDELTKKLEKLQAQFEATTKDRDEWKERFEKSKGDRDAAKERERKAAEERGEYEKSLAILQEQLEELKKGAEDSSAIKSQLETYKTAAEELEKIKEERHAELLQRLPDDKREKFKHLPIEDLKLIVEEFGESKVSMPKNGPANPGNGKVDFSTATITEQMEIASRRGMTPLEIARERLKAKK